MSAKYTTRMFDSLGDFAAHASGSPFKCQDTSWAGGTLGEAIKRTHEGDLSLVAQSEEMLAKFEALAFPTSRREWTNEVAGYVAHVPAFIAGHPASMRRRKKRENEVAPITIFVDIFASAAFSKKDILTRGAAVLALTRILSAYRPIELYVAFATTARRGESGCVAVKIDTTPLDLAHAAYALMGPSFLRQVTFSVMEKVFRSDPFPPLRVPLIALAEEMLPWGTQILAVPGVVSSITRDPEEWITQRIREAAPEVLGEEQVA